MPIDEIVVAVSCSATVIDEFELQLTKMVDKARNWMTKFQNWSTKDEIETRASHSRMSGTKLKAHFLKLNEEIKKVGGKTYIKAINTGPLKEEQQQL